MYHALISEQVTLGSHRVHVPGPLPIRLSVVMGNLRMQYMLTSLIQPGDTVVDVGANIGYNTLFAAQLVGQEGKVFALEPAQDNLAVLYENLFANHVQNVAVLPYAAGRERKVKQFYLRGDVSAVNSLYQDNFYHPITSTVDVLTAPLDDLVTARPALIKIDVEGGELDVLHGMARLLRDPSLQIIAEWHPALQYAAGYPLDALPQFLLSHGFSLQVATHTAIFPIASRDLDSLATKLLRQRSPVELLAIR